MLLFFLLFTTLGLAFELLQANLKIVEQPETLVIEQPQAKIISLESYRKSSVG